MGALFCLLIFVGICGALVKALALMTSPQQPQKPKIAADWEPPKEDPLPYAAKNNLLSPAERAFYERLKDVVAPSHRIFVKVRLADLFSVKAGCGSWQSHFNRISCKHVDFVLSDSNLAPLLAIELDDSSHDRQDRKDRDAFVDRVFAAAKTPILHFRAKRDYQAVELRTLLHPYVQTLTANLGTPPTLDDTLPADFKYMPREYAAKA